MAVFQRLFSRPFCVNISSPHIKRLIAASNLPEFEGLLADLAKTKLNVQSALGLMRRCIELKRVGDAKYRGRIPYKLVRMISDVTVEHLEEMNQDDIVTLVIGASDSNKSMDEYLLYRIARCIIPRIALFSVDQLITVGSAFCKRELVDLELLESITSHLSIISPDPSLGKLIHLLRSLSQVRLKPSDLVGRIFDRATKERLLGKDAISLLIAMAELDIEAPELSNNLWLIVEKHKLIFSHDDEYGLVFAYMRMNGSREVINRIVERASRENRISKRIKLLSDCASVGIVPAGSPLPGFRRDAKSKDQIHPSVSSGLHLEVTNVLEAMGYSPVLEVPAGSFILDTVLAY